MIGLIVGPYLVGAAVFTWWLWEDAETRYEKALACGMGLLWLPTIVGAGVIALAVKRTRR